jgi:hypothetical protein
MTNLTAYELLQYTSSQQDKVVEWHNGNELKSLRITDGLNKWLLRKQNHHHIRAMHSKVRMISINDDGSLNILVSYDERTIEVNIKDRERDALGVPYLEPIGIEKGE